jgi:hypothetical protein
MSQPTRACLPLGLVLISGIALSACSLPTRGPASDARQTPAALGSAVRGEITSASAINANDGSRYQRFTLPLPADSLIQFKLSGPLAGRLSLFDGDGQFLAASREDTDAAQLNHRVGAAGPYTVAVSGRDHLSFGPYQLSSAVLETRDSGTVNVGEAIAGWRNQSANLYSLQIDTAALYEITLRSNDFDALLRLNGNGQALEDDDGAGDLDARISAFLVPGIYRVEATAYESASSGLFTLDVRARELPSDMRLQNDGALNPGDSIAGVMTGNPNDYSLSLTQTTTLSIDMRSDDFDAYLELSGEGVALEDDDGGGDTHARISSTLPAGHYSLRARSYEPGSTGLFTLSLTATR